MALDSINLPNYQINIEDEYVFNLEIPKEAIDFLILILNKDILYISNVSGIVFHSTGKTLGDYIEDNRDKNFFAVSFGDIASFFKIFTRRDEPANVFHQYLIEDASISDTIKKQRVKKLLSGIKKYIDYLWEIGCVSSIDYYYRRDILSEKKQEEPTFHEVLKNDNMLFCSIPTYAVYTNVKAVYDIIWDEYSLFIDRGTEEYSFFYSNKRRPEWQNGTRPEEENSNLIQNPFPRIFVDIDAFNFFERLQEFICVDERKKLTNYSFIYRKMHGDGYIYEGVKESEFRKFLLKEYDVDLTKLKIIEYSTKLEREKLYSQLKI